jgi:hypothetical protein
MVARLAADAAAAAAACDVDSSVTAASVDESAFLRSLVNGNGDGALYFAKVQRSFTFRRLMLPPSVRKETDRAVRAVLASLIKHR